MTRILPAALAIGFAVGALSLVSQAASALPLAPVSQQAHAASDMTLVQFNNNNRNGNGGNRGGGGANRGGGGGGAHVNVGRGGGGRGGRNAAAVGAAVIGLGLLGAAAAANSAPARECWTERRPVFDRWGNEVGARRVRVCN